MYLPPLRVTFLESFKIFTPLQFEFSTLEIECTLRWLHTIYRHNLPSSVIDYLHLLWCVMSHAMCHLLSHRCRSKIMHFVHLHPSWPQCCWFSNLPKLECLCGLRSIALRNSCHLQLLPCGVHGTLPSWSLLHFQHKQICKDHKNAITMEMVTLNTMSFILGGCHWELPQRKVGWAFGMVGFWQFCYGQWGGHMLLVTTL